MRNVKEHQLKKCIFLTEEEYNNIIHSLFENEAIKIEFDCEGGISIHGIDPDDYFAVINDKLQVYFEVKIISMHIEGYEYPCMWIVYED